MRHSDHVRRHIRSLREARGYSQEYMAEMLDIAQSSYANLESGKSNLTVDRLLQVCEILESDAGLLLQNTVDVTSNLSGRVSAPVSSDDISPAVRQVYEAFITELKCEIEFLRGLVRKETI